MTELQNAIACATRVFELIDEPAQVPDAEGAAAPQTFEGHVCLDQVDFSYMKDVPLIENLSLEAKPGQKVAIVGPTGCGKTTLINLLMRFYDVCGGSISVDGTDIRMLTRDALRGGYGMVLQDTWLKSGTIREGEYHDGKPGCQ